MFNILYLPSKSLAQCYGHMVEAESLHYRTKSPDVCHTGGFFILVDFLGGCVVDMDGSRVVVSTSMGPWWKWARPQVGVTLGLFISMSALVAVEEGTVSFLGVWRCGRYRYGGVVLLSVGNAGWR